MLQFDAAAPLRKQFKGNFYHGLAGLYQSKNKKIA